MGTSKYLSNLICVVLVTSCTSLPRLNVIDAGERVSIVLAADSNELAEQMISNQTIGVDAGTGATGGAGAGALYGLSCGPWLWFCVPIGALVGAAYGGAAGIVVGVVESLSKDKVDQLNAQLSNHLRSHDPREALRNSLINNVESQWTVMAEHQNTELSLQLDALELRSYRREQVRLALAVSVTIRYLDLQGHPKQNNRSFQYEGSTAYVQSWLENRDQFIQKQFDAAYLTLAEEIRLVLSNH